MAIKIRKHTDTKKVIRFKKKKRIRGGLSGTANKPRLAVFKSNSHISVQLIDDTAGITILSASTLEKENKKSKLKCNIAAAKNIGSLIARRAIEKNIKEIVFDRSGYLYHGKIKTLADSAREAGLKF